MKRDIFHSRERAEWNARPFTAYPLHSQTTALRRKKALAVYFVVRDAGSEAAAILRAQSLWHELTGRTICERTVRRWASRVRAFGGPTSAPITAYLDGKSCPHFRARKKELKAFSLN
jgi:hypothetical protein